MNLYPVESHGFWWISGTSEAFTHSSGNHSWKAGISWSRWFVVALHKRKLWRWYDMLKNTKQVSANPYLYDLKNCQTFGYLWDRYCNQASLAKNYWNTLYFTKIPYLDPPSTLNMRLSWYLCHLCGSLEGLDRSSSHQRQPFWDAGWLLCRCPYARRKHHVQWLQNAVRRFDRGTAVWFKCHGAVVPCAVRSNSWSLRCTRTIKVYD